LLTHPTLELMHQLGFNGMAKAFSEIEASGEGATLTHPEWLGLLLDREVTYRHDKRLRARLRYARLRHQAAIEDVDYRAARGLDRALFNKLVEGSWIDAHDNLILCGPLSPTFTTIAIKLTRYWIFLRPKITGSQLTELSPIRRSVARERIIEPSGLPVAPGNLPARLLPYLGARNSLKLLRVTSCSSATILQR
jgi:hypothetical protein